ncbi:MAG TPA: hypothetical protein VN843_14025, partial [Anaerolineales bacterium]|nr:hypothetical protein [Anaerolineales bacterium]
MRPALGPIVLASIGLVILVLAASTMPLFEWRISAFVEDFPSTHVVYSFPSPWAAKLGDSFDDDFYIHSKVSVSKDTKECRKEDLNFVIRRSQNDTALERLSLSFYRGVLPWLSVWGLIEIAVSGIYIWWFTLSYERRPISSAVTLTLIAVVFGCCLMNIFVYGMKVAGGMFPYYFGTVDCYPGTVAFNASLSKVHYETLLALFAGILLGLGAMGVIVRQ